MLGFAPRISKLAFRCENCGQPALEEDKVCWHCGWQFPGYDEQDLEKVEIRASWRGNQPVSTVLMYGSMTAIVILAALLVMSALGRQPLVQAGVQSNLGPGWVDVVDRNRFFTFSLPVDWTWWDRADDRQAAALDSMLADEPIVAGTYPLGTQADDLEILFLAQPPKEEQPVFLAVARSARLNGLSYAEAARFLQENKDFQIQQAQVIEDFDESHIFSIVEIPMGESSTEASESSGSGFLRCQQQFIRGQTAVLLVTACAANARYTAFQARFGIILGSFQRLYS
jgi:hypothetical protein